MNTCACTAVNAASVPTLMPPPFAALHRDDDVDEHRHEREERRDQREEPAADQLLLDLQVGQPLALLAVALAVVGLATEHLREQHSRDAERLLGDGAHLGERALRLGRDLAADAPDDAGQEDEERQRRDGHERELPVEPEHRDDDRGRIAMLVRNVWLVSVTTACRPPTSFASRLWISPVRVAVKKRNDNDCRWANSFAQVAQHVLADRS